MPEATRDLRVKRAQQKEMVTLFNRMVTSTTEDSDLGIEKQKLQDFFQEITATIERTASAMYVHTFSFAAALEQLSPSVFWKYTRGSKYKAETEQSKFYKTVHRWGVRVCH